MSSTVLGQTGFNSTTQNLKTQFGQSSTLNSNYNNGYSNLSFQAQSFLPTDGSNVDSFNTTLKAQQFDGAREFTPVLAALGSNNTIMFPPALAQFLSDPFFVTPVAGFNNAWSGYFKMPDPKVPFTFPYAV